MDFKKFGLDHGPVLFCIPGLIGGPEDFNEMLGTFGKHFTIIIVDPNHKTRVTEGMNLSLETMNELSYDSTSEMVKDFLLKNFPGRDYFFLGVSLGGKVAYDFATKFTHLFKGAVITDVGPGSFSESELFKTVEGIVDTVDLTLAWPELKKSLQVLIPDKNLRILIQTQIGYPNKEPPAVWKTGMKNFEKLLKRQSLDDQEVSFSAVDSTLAAEGKVIHVLHSEKTSGIGNRMYESMKTMKSIRLYEVPDSTHFLHISHKDLIIEKVLLLINLK